MDFFLSFLYCVISAILSGIVFYIIFSALNESVIQLFVPIKRIVNKLKWKNILRSISFLITIFLAVNIKDFFNLGDVWFGVIIGFFNSLSDIIFETGLAAPKKDRVTRES
ncbi:hypothetical protein JHL18_24625 [Clostridium sp. YIM B02505]|uniref:Holin n=1 Tax=Clostridium yunnanense TaxID=2800325 RepID=A0ABS1EWV9_9CLOT|nr:hypothetical protein [Clostridium yunnanense]MBK1813809.1 hypothetical protein [Clostridium yunnanense]